MGNDIYIKLYAKKIYGMILTQINKKVCERK